MSDEAVVLVTCPADQAEHIATVLVEAKLAACVNILPGAISVYKWEGKLCKDAETMLVIKSSLRVYESLEAKVLEIHPYEVPEIILLPIHRGSKSYLDWINFQLEESKNASRSETSNREHEISKRKSGTINRDCESSSCETEISNHKSETSSRDCESSSLESEISKQSVSSGLTRKET